MCLETEVFCYKCFAETAREDAEQLSVQQYNNGQAMGLVRGWICWFCLQEPSEPLAICLSSSLYLKKQATRVFKASGVEATGFE